MATTIDPRQLDGFPREPAGRLSVNSEVGPLRRVIVHRPGIELRRLTPANRAELLFDDVVWVERACEDHDAFAAVLRSCSVEVLYLEDLLVQTLRLPAGAQPGSRRDHGVCRARADAGGAARAVAVVARSG